MSTSHFSIMGGFNLVKTTVYKAVLQVLIECTVMLVANNYNNIEMKQLL